MTPRPAFVEVETSGIKVKVVGDNSNDFNFKIKNKEKFKKTKLWQLQVILKYVLQQCKLL